MRLIPTPPAAEEPAPCPWCGGNELFSPADDGSGYSVTCRNCAARGPECHAWGDAIAAWNRIASPGKPEREVVVGMSVSEARELIHSIDAPLGNDAAAVVLYRFRDLLRSALTPTEEKP